MSNQKSKKNNVKENHETTLPDEVSGTTPPPTDTQDSDKILDNVVETQEQVSEQVAERIADMEQKDSAGQIFNADIHATGRDGTPSVTRGGKFRLRKQRKDETTDEDLQRISVATTSAGLFVTMGVTLFGDEWLPDEKEKEIEQLVRAFDEYYKAAGVVNIPPSVGLVIALSGYTLKRVTKPITKSKLGKIKDAIKDRVLKVFRRNKKTVQ